MDHKNVLQHAFSDGAGPEGGGDQQLDAEGNPVKAGSKKVVSAALATSRPLKKPTSEDVGVMQAKMAVAKVKENIRTATLAVKKEQIQVDAMPDGKRKQEKEKALEFEKQLVENRKNKAIESEAAVVVAKQNAHEIAAAVQQQQDKEEEETKQKIADQQEQVAANNEVVRALPEGTRKEAEKLKVANQAAAATVAQIAQEKKEVKFMKEDLQQIPEGPQREATKAAIEKKEASIEKESQAAVRNMINADKAPDKSEVNEAVAKAETEAKEEKAEIAKASVKVAAMPPGKARDQMESMVEKEERDMKAKTDHATAMEAAVPGPKQAAAKQKAADIIAVSKAEVTKEKDKVLQEKLKVAAMPPGPDKEKAQANVEKKEVKMEEKADRAVSMEASLPGPQQAEKQEEAKQAVKSAGVEVKVQQAKVLKEVQALEAAKALAQDNPALKEEKLKVATMPAGPEKEQAEAAIEKKELEAKDTVAKKAEALEQKQTVLEKKQERAEEMKQSETDVQGMASALPKREEPALVAAAATQEVEANKEHQKADKIKLAQEKEKLEGLPDGPDKEEAKAAVEKKEADLKQNADDTLALEASVPSPNQHAAQQKIKDQVENAKVEVAEGQSAVAKEKAQVEQMPEGPQKAKAEEAVLQKEEQMKEKADHAVALEASVPGPGQAEAQSAAKQHTKDAAAALKKEKERLKNLEEDVAVSSVESQDSGDVGETNVGGTTKEKEALLRKERIKVQLAEKRFAELKRSEKKMSEMEIANAEMEPLPKGFVHENAKQRQNDLMAKVEMSAAKVDQERIEVAQERIKVAEMPEGQVKTQLEATVKHDTAELQRKSDNELALEASVHGVDVAEVKETDKIETEQIREKERKRQKLGEKVDKLEDIGAARGAEKAMHKLLEDRQIDDRKKNLRDLKRQEENQEEESLAKQADLMRESSDAQAFYKRKTDNDAIDTQMSDHDALNEVKNLEIDNNALAHVAPAAKQAQRLQEKLDAIERQHPGAVISEELKNAKKAGEVAAKEVQKKAEEKEQLSNSKEDKKERSEYWKSCSEYAKSDGLGTSTYTMKISSEVRAAGEVDGKNSEISAALGPKRTKRGKEKVTAVVDFRVHDLDLSCVNETKQRLGLDMWTYDDVESKNMPPVTASVRGTDRYLGHVKPVKLRAITIHGYKAKKYRFDGGWKAAHTAETPMLKEMQTSLLDKLRCGFAFTQSDSGHVLQFFHETKAPKACIKIKASIAEYFESYYYANGKAKYRLKHTGAANKESVDVETDHYYDGKLASVCRNTARTSRDFYARTSNGQDFNKRHSQAGKTIEKHVQIGRGVSRCCTHYSMIGKVEKSECIFRLREAEGGTGTTALTAGRRRRTMELQGLESEKEKQQLLAKLDEKVPETGRTINPPNVKSPTEIAAEKAKSDWMSNSSQRIRKVPAMQAYRNLDSPDPDDVFLLQGDTGDGIIDSDIGEDADASVSGDAATSSKQIIEEDEDEGIPDDVADSAKFDWDDIWSQKSWTDDDDTKDKKSDLASEVGGPFMLGESNLQKKKKVKHEGNEDGDGATKPVMSGTVRVKIELTVTEPNNTPHGKTAPAKILSDMGYEETLIQLSNAWGSKVELSQPHANHHTGINDLYGVDSEKFKKLMNDVLLDVGADEKYGELKHVFRQDPSYAKKAADLLIKRGGSKKAKRLSIGAIGATGNAPEAQEALIQLLSTSTNQMHAATAAQQIINPESGLLQKLHDCSFASHGSSSSEMSCACMISLNHLAHRLHMQKRHVEAKSIVDKTWSKRHASCALAALANAGPAATHKAEEMMEMAVKHSKDSDKEMLMDSLKDNEHPEIDNFLQMQVGSGASMPVQEAAFASLAMRKADTTESAIRRIHARLQSGQISDDSIKRKMIHSFKKRLSKFHSPAADEILSSTVLLQMRPDDEDDESLMLPEDGTKLGEVGDEDEEDRLPGNPAPGTPEALAAQELDDKMTEQQAKTSIDAKQQARWEKEITQKVKPEIVRKMKRKLYRQITDKVRKGLKPDVDQKMKVKLAADMVKLRHTIKMAGYDIMEKKKLEAALGAKVKKHFYKELDFKVRKETKYDVKKREETDIPRMVQKELEVALQAKMEAEVKKAGAAMEVNQFAAGDEEEAVAPGLRYTNMKTCIPFDKTKKMSCERGARKCMRVNDQRLGCVGGSAFITADWSSVNGYKVEAVGGYMGEMYNWKRQLMEASTEGNFNGKVNKDSTFIKHSKLKFYDFHTQTDKYAYHNEDVHTENEQGDSCTAFQAPKTIESKELQMDMFHDTRCFGLPVLMSVCGTATLEAHIGAEFGLNLVTPGYDAVVAYTKPVATFDLHTSIIAEAYAFSVYGRGKTTLISGEAPISTVFSFTKFKGGYEGRWAVRTLASSLAIGVKGPGKASEEVPAAEVAGTPDDTPMPEDSISMVEVSEGRPGSWSKTGCELTPDMMACQRGVAKCVYKQAKGDTPATCSPEANSASEKEINEGVEQARRATLKDPHASPEASAVAQQEQNEVFANNQLSQNDINVAFNKAYDGVAGEKAYSFESNYAPIISTCTACTDWDGPNQLYSVSGIKGVGVTTTQAISGDCGPVGKIEAVPMPILPNNLSAKDEEEVKAKRGPNPQLGLRPEATKKALMKEQRQARRSKKELLAAQIASKSAKARADVAARELVRNEKYQAVSARQLDKAEQEARIATKQYRKDSAAGYGFMSKQKFDLAFERKKASKYALSQAKLATDKARAANTIKKKDVEERSNKMDRVKKKADTRADNVKIARLQYVLAKQDQAALEGKSSERLRKEVEEARKIADTATMAEENDTDKIEHNVLASNILIAERKQKMRHMEREMEEAQGEKAKAEKMLTKERNIKGSQRLEKANERRKKGKALVRQLSKKEQADAAREAKFESVLSKKSVVFAVKTTPFQETANSKARMDILLRRAKRRAARKLKRDTDFSNWLTEGQMKAKERTEKWTVAREAISDADTVEAGARKESDMAKSMLTQSNAKIENLQDKLAVAKSSVEKETVQGAIIDEEKDRETRSYTVRQSTTRLRYATLQVKEREKKAEAAAEQKENADLVKAARKDVATAKRSESAADADDSAMRKQLRKLEGSRRRASEPGLNPRRRSTSREPEQLSSKGGERRRRTSMPVYKDGKMQDKGSTEPVSIEALKMKALASPPEAVLKKEIRSMQGRRRSSQAERSQEASNSMKIWKHLEAQISATSTKETKAAARLASQKARKALEELSKITGQPILSQKKAGVQSDDEAAFERDQESKMIGDKQKFEDKTLEAEIGSETDPKKKAQLEKARAEAQANAEKKIVALKAGLDDMSDVVSDGKEKKPEEKVSVGNAKKEAENTEEFKIADAMQKSSIEASKGLIEKASDGAPEPPRKPAEPLPPSPEVEATNAEVDDVKSKLEVQQKRLEKAKSEAEKINVDKQKFESMASSVDANNGGNSWTWW